MARKKKRKAAPGDIATNRQASFRFNLLDKFEAGIVLQGSEVKSLREGGVQLKDAYAEVRDGEVWLRNMHIAPYKPARENHEPERPRKLLLHRREIERLVEASAEKGLTIVPTRIYFKGPRAKVELALAKGKDMYDKRRSIKDRDVKREIDRAMSERTGRCRSAMRGCYLFLSGPAGTIQIAPLQCSSFARLTPALRDRGRARQPSGSARGGSIAGACAGPRTRGPRPS